MDLIDRDAALNCFHCWADKRGDVHEPDEMPEYERIEALPAIEIDADAVSRQEVLNKLKEWYEGALYLPVEFKEMLEGLPPAQPMRKKGKWVPDDAVFWGIPYHCDQCGERTMNTLMGKPRWNFCPMCGADMRGDSNG